MAYTMKLVFVATLVVGFLAAAVAQGEGGGSATPGSTPNTASPDPTPTTGSPGSPATDESPGSPATNESPGSPATNESPGSPATNESPGSPATNESPGSPATNESPGSPATDESPGSSPTPATTVPATTEFPDPCQSQPCKGGSTCHVRASGTFICLCLRGDYYDESSKRCSTAKVFPGELSQAGLTYKDALADKKSKDFLETSNQIIDSMKNTFIENTDYKESTVLEFRPMSSRSKGVVASLEIIFSASSDVNEDSVDKIIDAAATEGGPLSGTTFTGTPLCDDSRNPCDTETSECKSGNGIFNCTCLAGYVPTSYANRICLACSSGFHPDESGKCQLCGFGYSGFNCKESWKLTLVIVGSVLGALLLITIILLPIVAKKTPKKSSKKDKVKETGNSKMSQMSRNPMGHNGFAESRPASAQGGSTNPLAAFANAGQPRLPRATTTSGWGQSSNLEMTPSSSQQNLIPGGRNMRPYENADNISGNVYNRPQSNPYAQNRPPFNPYGQSQGQSNPYFSSDSGRRY